MRLTELIPIPPGINQGLTPARQTTLLSLLGTPRESFDQTCQSPTNRALLSLLALRQLGIFRAYGLKPALDDLEQIFADIHSEQPDVFSALGYSGMLCARLVRGSTHTISNHAWGIAIDLNLDGRLDSPGNGQVQCGLALIAPIFQRHGWYWGAGFSREDAMHFEASDERVRQWHAEGRLLSTLGGNGRAPVAGQPLLALGDRGPEVRALQEQLHAQGYLLEVDGIFGPVTRAALIAFQSSQALSPSGMLDADTREALAALVGGARVQPSTAADDPILRLGSRGAAVEAWQRFLITQGLASPGSADGSFGPLTRTATVLFQQAQGLVPDGVVGPKTRAEAEALGLTTGAAAVSPAPAASAGLRRMRNQELTADVIQKAARLLYEHVREPIGTDIPFESAGQNLVGRLEWHYDERRGKHKGLSVFVVG